MISKDTPVQKQMYIVSTNCYKCDDPMKVALIVGNIEVNNAQVYGPETFTQNEQDIAKQHDVYIKDHFSATRQENYKANTCQKCNSFIGHHYLFTDYYCPIQYGDCQFEIINL